MSMIEKTIRLEGSRATQDAQALHANFYEDFMPADMVRLYADDVECLVHALNPGKEA